jgi:hypothetical protein
VAITSIFTRVEYYVNYSSFRDIIAGGITLRGARKREGYKFQSSVGTGGCGI